MTSVVRKVLMVCALVIMCLVGASTHVAAQTPVQVVPYPAVDLYIWWSHDKINLSYFEMKLDSQPFSEVVPLETRATRFRYPFPEGLSRGEHVLMIRACPPVGDTSVTCSDTGELVVILTIKVNKPYDIIIGPETPPTIPTIPIRP